MPHEVKAPAVFTVFSLASLGVATLTSMDPKVLLDAISAKVVDAGAAPLAAVGLSVFVRGARGGWVTHVGGSTPVVFDLASVTKPMTAVAFALSALDREKKLSHFLPELEGTAAGAASIELLLSHRAGLLPHVKLFDEKAAAAQLSTAKERIEALKEVADALRPDLASVAPHPPVYSDIGYLLVGEAMARALDLESAGAVIQALVIAPLALASVEGAWLGPPSALPVDADALARMVAPTEIVPWRGGTVLAEIHDENAWIYGGRAGCGHAGIFGTVAGVLAFGRAVEDARVRGEGPYRNADLSWTMREREGGTLRAGWDGKSPQGSSAGGRASAEVFGHLGFTGTSIWIDPVRDAVVSLLSNRVHPTRENARIRELRPTVHDELFSLADQINDKLTE